MLTSCGEKSEPAKTSIQKPLGAPKSYAPQKDYVPTIVNREIQAGIEKHIAEKIASEGGYFHVPFEGGTLKLKLVRVHVEYLASLGPRMHFACVDMAGNDGQFYDIDFFLEGVAGDMKVTETTVHKLNGKPFYLWRQQEDKSWIRASVEDASKELLGVITGHDQFEFRYQATIPALEDGGRCWIPIPSSDDFQKVEIKTMNVPESHKIISDSENGNKILFIEFPKGYAGGGIEIIYDVFRREKGAYPGMQEDVAKYLAKFGEEHPEKIKSAAEKAIAGLSDDLMKARSLYDHVVNQMDYKKIGDSWGKADALYACDSASGNCTDYHAYFIALARAVGIPARFAIGVAIPSERNDGGCDGYHCWAEFFANGKWWPVDISEADKFSSLSMYYFGHHPANRLEFSKGQNLVTDPLPASGSINFLAYPLIEVKGRKIKAPTLFLFRRTPCGSCSAQQNNP
jgi:hypothetical protein